MKNKLKIPSIQLSKPKTIVLMSALAIVSVPAFALYQTLAVQECSIATAPSTTDTRLITLGMSNCGNAKYFSVSESPDFGKSDGPKIEIKNVASDNSYADVSVTYPNGQSGSIDSPYSIAERQKNVKVLAVYFAFEDDSGKIAGNGAYQTTDWLNRFLFDSSNTGFDGYLKNSSVNDYLFQSTNGRLRISGDAYPSIVKLPLEKYRTMLQNNDSYSLDADILDAIEEQNPGYLAAHDYDFLLSLSSDAYSVDRTNYIHTMPRVHDGAYGSIRRSLTHTLPVDTTSSVLAAPIQETRIASDAETVVTRYNPQSVEGVWLESDTDRTGKNYYTGGKLVRSSNTKFVKISLGSSLPSSDTRVVVRYTADAGNKVEAGAGKVIGSSWYPNLVHEFMHDITDVPGASFSQRSQLGDLYMRPSNVDKFDLMASGNESGLHPVTDDNYNEPSLLSASNRIFLGYQQPLTLNYEKNSGSNFRIYRSEYGGAANSSRTTLIKVPLRPKGELGLETRVGASTTAAQQYAGSEYLLLEWRSKADDLENDMHNFDRLLTSEGLAIYHVVEAEPYKLTGTYTDIVRIVDATPPNNSFSEGYSDTSDSPVTFGPQSGVMSYSAGDFWQEKVTSTETQSFQYLLSEGSGSKTLYVKFANENGDVVGTQQLSVNLTNDDSATDRLPSISLDMANNTSISTFKNVKASYNAPNGAKALRFYIDDEMKIDRVEPSISPTAESYMIRAIDLKAGQHELKVDFYDDAMNLVSKKVSFSIPSGNADETAPSVTITSPSSQTVNSTVSIDADASDNNKIAKVETYVDGYIRNVDTASPYSFSWNTKAISNGTHTISVKAYDVAGNSSSDSKQVVVGNQDNTPPTTPSNLKATVSDSQAVIDWQASTDDSPGTIINDVYRNGTKVASVSSSSYTDSDLSSGSSYTYYVIARDAAGNKSERSELVSISTAPAKPKNLQAAALSSSEVLLTWTANADVGDSAVYSVYRGGALVASVGGTEYVDSGLAEATTYSYYVVVRDGNGTTSDPSDPQTVKTLTASQNQRLVGALKGNVKRGNGNDVADVTITIKGNGITRTAKTGKAGNYHLDNIDIGSYTLTAKKSGFTTKTFKITINLDRTTTRNVTLIHR